ncbi:hypothetical protein SLEP1_g22351 [Rubroshorea leprosula]|uniref:Uncharacterized protein n=1 Tax=Rubroshorea leprosula TaxID=152421 RepID=A0AAV5JKX7_9ROSI|nr:hypothetical protein SLEP1_g22351 [Rubroshorea leprosula]
MNHLLVTTGIAVPLMKKSKAPRVDEVEERVRGRRSTPQLVATLIARDVGVVTLGWGKSFPPRLYYLEGYNFMNSSSRKTVRRFIDPTFLDIDLTLAKDEVNLHGGAGVVRHIFEASELNELRDKMATLKRATELMDWKGRIYKEKYEYEFIVVDEDMVKEGVDLLHKAKKFYGKISAFPVREGNKVIDLEVVLALEMMVRLENDVEFMQYFSRKEA